MGATRSQLRNQGKCVIRNTDIHNVRDDNGKVCATRLAEEIAHDNGHDKWLDDPGHLVWEIALELASAHNGPG